ncbi:MAG TPA: hypothetical protein VH639_04235 [Bryobacteraceae bacterium]|jgi:hypothetical protein
MFDSLDETQGNRATRSAWRRADRLVTLIVEITTLVGIIIALLRNPEILGSFFHSI